jgi:hypothetical protein
MNRTPGTLFFIWLLLGPSACSEPLVAPPRSDFGAVLPDAADGRSLVCQPGAGACNGAQAIRCADDGQRWISVTTCPPSQICQLGSCRDECSSPIKAILSFGTPWHGSPLAESLLLKDVLGKLLGGEQAVRDLVPGRVEASEQSHPICAPRSGVGGDALGLGLAGECAAGYLLLKQMGYPHNDGLVPLASALPKEVTSFGSYPFDHYALIREARVASDVVRQIKQTLGIGQPGTYKLILVNGLTGGHEVSPEALQEAIKGFGASNIFFCPTDSSQELSYLKVGSEQVLVVGTRGLLSAGMDSLEAQSQYVAAKIVTLQKLGFIKPQDKLLLVGHSMGGLASFGVTYLMEHGLSAFAD